MPFKREDIDNAPIWFAKQNEVWVTVGPFGVSVWKENKIPLDGRQYKCGGQIIFKNGSRYRASFTINTTTFDFLDRESVYLNLNEVWYSIHEPELLMQLQLKQEEIFPYEWIPDRELEYHVLAPYKMNFY